MSHGADECLGGNFDLILFAQMCQTKEDSSI